MIISDPEVVRLARTGPLETRGPYVRGSDSQFGRGGMGHAERVVASARAWFLQTGRLVVRDQPARLIVESVSKKTRPAGFEPATRGLEVPPVQVQRKAPSGRVGLPKPILSAARYGREH